MKIFINIKYKDYLKILFILSIYINSIYSQELNLFFEKNYFSPNNDGNNDLMRFNLVYDKKNLPSDWKVIISDESEKIIKVFQAYHGLRKKKKFFEGFFSKEDGKIFIPEYIDWVGTDKNGKLLSDGRYKVKLIFYFNNKTLESRERFFYLDSRIPLSKLTAEHRFLSPNNDKLNDQISINQIFDGEPLDRWKGVITNSNGYQLKSYIWESVRIPKQILWDGRDDRGILQDEGIYTYSLYSEDFSENKHIEKLSYINLSKEEGPDIFPELEEFSPNNDNIKDKIKFKLYGGSEKKIDSWKIEVRNKKNPKKYSWQRVEFGKELPAEYYWNGNGMDEKNVLPEGEYEVLLYINHGTNREKISVPKTFTLSLKKPEIEFYIKGDHFTPDGDYTNDIVEIIPKINHLSINTWKVSVVEKFKPDRNGYRVLKKWSGYGNLPPKLTWDGMSDDGILTFSLSDLVIFFSFRNELNEYKTYQVKEFNSGILMNQISKDEFRIIIPEHVFNKSNEKFTYIIEKLVEILTEYPDYIFQIQSHSMQPGDHKENKQKTEERAKEIYQLISKKMNISKKNIAYPGCGELYPLYNVEDDYKQAKNERIEIILTKTKKSDCYEGKNQ